MLSLKSFITHAGKDRPDRMAWGVVLAGAVLWLSLYRAVKPVANWLTYQMLRLPQDSHLGEAVAFFLYDVPKILLLLSGIVFVMTTLRSFFTPEQTRRLLGGKRLGSGNVLAALLGIITPFCSCSAVPLFIGFVEAGIPLGVTFSFLIAAPMINEIAVVMLFGLFGLKTALIYVTTGLTIAVLAGVIIGALRLERYVEDFVWQTRMGNAGLEREQLTWAERFSRAWENTRAIVGKVWPYVVIGIAVGAGIHGFVPEEALASIMGKNVWWSVPAAVLLGIPMYSNAAGIIPVVQALMAKGAALGTVLAFMMSVIALSLPEMVILRRVLKPQLIIVFISVMALGIVLVGYLFNLITLT